MSDRVCPTFAGTRKFLAKIPTLPPGFEFKHVKELCSREFGYVWFNALPSKPTLVNTGGVVAYGVSLELSVRQEFGCFSGGFRKKPGHKSGTPLFQGKNKGALRGITKIYKKIQRRRCKASNNVKISPSQ